MGNFCIDLGYLVEGFVAGMLLASVLDAGFLSWESRYSGNQDSQAISLSIAPAFEPRTGAKGLSLSGRF